YFLIEKRMQIRPVEIVATLHLIWKLFQTSSPYPLPQGEARVRLHGGEGIQPFSYQCSNSTRTARDEMRQIDVFPPRPECRHDHCPIKRSIGPAFHRADLDRAKVFQTNQIVAATL